MISNENIELDYFAEEDFEQLISWSGDERFLLQWAGPQFTYPLTNEQLSKYVESSNEIAHSEILIYKVIDCNSNNVIGHISISAIDRKNESCRLGKILIGDPLKRGKGIGTLVVQKVLVVCFIKLKMHKVSLGVFDFNKGAIESYRKVGFKIDGVLRDARKYKNEYWNLIEMSMLNYEWEKLKW